jgi:hypothetical protein
MWYNHIHRHLRNPFIFLPKPVQLQGQPVPFLTIIYGATMRKLFNKLREKIKTLTDGKI